jgi:Spy/CpxP family protein refolding chaperone
MFKRTAVLTALGFFGTLTIGGLAIAGPGGPMKGVMRALEEVELTEDQQATIDEIKEDAKAERQSRREEGKANREAMFEQLTADQPDPPASRWHTTASTTSWRSTRP